MIGLPSPDFRRTPVTMTLAGVMIAMQIAFTIKPIAWEHYYNAYFGLLPYIWLGELWRPLTSSLMHGGILHAAFNTYWLVWFGVVLEPKLGSVKFFGLIILLSYMSMMPEYVVTGFGAEEPIAIVGFSGVVYGLFGLCWVGRRFDRDLYQCCDDQVAQLLIGWFFICIVITWAGIISVANIAHGAGWLFGWLYGQAIFNPLRKKPIWLILAVVASLIVLSSLIACPGHAGFEQARNFRMMQGR
jgi:membrane associated rhomboid family serine protease